MPSEILKRIGGVDDLKSRGSERCRQRHMSQTDGMATGTCATNMTKKKRQEESEEVEKFVRVKFVLFVSLKFRT